MRNLSCDNAIYLNFTEAEFVGSAHNYFSEGEPLQNQRLKEVFLRAFNGERAEQGLSFDVGIGAYLVS